MPKLESFDGKIMTKWEGLWKQDGSYYRSAVLNLATFKKFKGSCRVYLIKNKYYKKDTNKPQFLFRICDSNGENIREIEVQDTLEQIPTAHWEYHYFIDGLTAFEYYRCSHCGGEPYYKRNIFEEYKYCPYCGAEMEEL